MNTRPNSIFRKGARKRHVDRRFVATWPIICEFEDDDDPAHPETIVTRSLERAGSGASCDAATSDPIAAAALFFPLARTASTSSRLSEHIRDRATTIEGRETCCCSDHADSSNIGFVLRRHFDIYRTPRCTKLLFNFYAFIFIYSFFVPDFRGKVTAESLRQAFTARDGINMSGSFAAGCTSMIQPANSPGNQ